MDSSPDGLHQRLIDLPCMIVCPSNHLDLRPTAGPNPLQLQTYCRHHKKLESFGFHVSYAVAISAFRPSQEIWLKLFNKDKQRSHLCHNFYCEHPLHSISETPEQNKNQNFCRYNAARLGKRYDARTAAANTYEDCLQEPPCFSHDARLITDMEEYGAEAFRLAMRTHGMCKECKLDFPVHLGRTDLKTRESESYSRRGRIDGCVADEWHSAQWASSMSSLSLRWFDVLHQHRTQVHLGIGKGEEVWANMKELQDLWWSSIEVAHKGYLFTYGKDISRNKRGIVYQSDLSLIHI